jgi:hypothetical protein
MGFWTIVVIDWFVPWKETWTVSCCGPGGPGGEGGAA